VSVSSLNPKPRGLDLFSGAGGASMGYHLAGFEMTGVDIVKQPRYPFDFVQDDALEYLAEHGTEFDFIAASPPCQAYSITKHSHSKEHPELIEPTRELLQATGLPYVMENVVGAPMATVVELCGASFGLTATDLDGMPLVLRRHRLFESNVMLMQQPCECRDFKAKGFRVGGVYGGGPSNRDKSWKRGGYTPPASVRAELMGIDWMTQKELTQAIPPAFTRWIGEQLIASLEQVA